MKNAEAGSRLPAFLPDRGVVHDNPTEWSWGPEGNEARWVGEHRSCIARAMAAVLFGAGIMQAYFRRGVSPLMPRPLRLFKMSTYLPEADLQACRIAVGADMVPEIEFRNRFREILATQPAFPVVGSPQMAPDREEFDLVSRLATASPSLCSAANPIAVCVPGLLVPSHHVAGNASRGRGGRRRNAPREPSGRRGGGGEEEGRAPAPNEEDVTGQPWWWRRRRQR